MSDRIGRKPFFYLSCYIGGVSIFVHYFAAKDPRALVAWANKDNMRSSSEPVLSFRRGSKARRAGASLIGQSKLNGAKSRTEHTAKTATAAEIGAEFGYDTSALEQTGQWYTQGFETGPEAAGRAARVAAWVRSPAFHNIAQS